jgi:hypothetical protein
MLQAMSIAAMRTAYVDEWVAAQVTQVDRVNVPVAGVMLIHSPEKTVVYRYAKEYLAHQPTTRLYIFFAGDPIPEGVGVVFAFG